MFIFSGLHGQSLQIVVLQGSVMIFLLTIHQCFIIRLLQQVVVLSLQPKFAENVAHSEDVLAAALRKCQ